MVPAWNAEAFIGPTLDSLRAQTYPNLEVLISDDASTDSTAEICDRYAAEDCRFSVIRQPRNLGWIGNVNTLFERAEGTFVVMAFHDDLLAPRYIEECVAALERNPGAVVAYSDITLVWHDGRRDEIRHACIDRIDRASDRMRSIASHEGDWWVPLRGVIDASAVRHVGGLKRHRAGEFSADWPWLMSLATAGTFVRVPENLLTKVYREKSLSRSWDHYSLRSLGAVTLAALSVVASSGLALRDKAGLVVPTTKLLRERAPGRLAQLGRAAQRRLVARTR